MKTRKLTYLSFFIALGILLPQIFHMLGGPGLGSMMLPMHIPAILSGMLLGPVSGAIVAAASVLVGAMMGMPPMPIAIFMFFELIVYGLASGYLYNIKQVNIYVALFGTMFAGRTVSMILMILAVDLLGFNLPPAFGTIAMFSVGIPGMIMQIILIPILVLSLRRFFSEFRQG